MENTPPAIAAAMARLITDPEAARAMGDNGRRAVRHALDWDVVARQMIGAYHSALRVADEPALVCAG